MRNWVRLSERDQVVIALTPFAAGDTLQLDNGQILSVKEDIPKGHKVLTAPVAAGQDIYKFGYSIGKAKQDITPGSWVHAHNLGTGLGSILNYSYEPVQQDKPQPAPSAEIPMFQGYVRPNGEIGIRNEIWIINTVGCINENNGIESFKQAIGEYDPQRVKFMSAQTEEDELETGLALTEELIAYAGTFRREPVPISKLKLGLKCGGSDGFSGITANPLVGSLSDRLIASGGTAILTEVPEMFGAETILMNRAADSKVFESIVALINDFKQYFIRHGQEIYENPSPGNKAGGISTLEEKSLGCTQKGGRAIVQDVVSYGERVRRSGLNLLEAPGNDLVSVTALTAAGAHIVLFTTGRGTPFGGPVPTVKIATNSELAERKRNWIDYNAGQLLEGKSMAEMTDELWRQLLDLASGKTRTHNERNGFREIAIFKDGVIL